MSGIKWLNRDKIWIILPFHQLIFIFSLSPWFPCSCRLITTRVNFQLLVRESINSWTIIPGSYYSFIFFSFVFFVNIHQLCVQSLFKSSFCTLRTAPSELRTATNTVNSLFTQTAHYPLNQTLRYISSTLGFWWYKAIQICAFLSGVVSLFHLRQADRRLTPPPPALCRVKAELRAALTRFRH